MASYGNLFDKLIEAKSQPSRAYRDLQSALGAIEQTGEGYLTGQNISDTLRKRKLSQMTLAEALGQTGGLENFTPEMGALHAPTIKEIALLGKSQPQTESVMTQEDALKRGSVPKGTRIVAPTGESFVYIGNSPDGRPQIMNKQGKIQFAEVPGGGPVLPKSSTMPTSSTRSSAEFAKTIIPHISTMRSLIKKADAKGYIGPGSGRAYNLFLAGKIGSTGNSDADRLLGQLRATDSLLKTGAMRVHFGAKGGQQMYDHFSNLLNSGKQSSAQLNGALDGIQSFMEGYAQAGTPGGYVPPQSEGIDIPEEQPTNEDDPFKAVGL